MRPPFARARAVPAQYVASAPRPWTRTTGRSAERGPSTQTERRLPSSAAKTSRCAPEIAARAADELFEWLDAPVRRVAAKDVFCGYAPQLEDATLPQTDDILTALRELVAY